MGGEPITKQQAVFICFYEKEQELISSRNTHIILSISIYGYLGTEVHDTVNEKRSDAIILNSPIFCYLRFQY